MPIANRRRPRRGEPQGGGHCAARTPGFTLIELLVVIAIIGIVYGLLHPVETISCRSGTDNNRRAISVLEAIHDAETAFSWGDLDQDGQENYGTIAQLMAHTSLANLSPINFTSHYGHYFSVLLSPDRTLYIAHAIPLPPNASGDPILSITEYGQVTCEWPPKIVNLEAAFQKLAVELLQGLRDGSRDVAAEDVEAIIRPAGNISSILSAFDADGDGRVSLGEASAADHLKLARELRARLLPGIPSGDPIGNDQDLRRILAEGVAAIDALFKESGAAQPEVTISEALEQDPLGLLYSALGHRLAIGNITVATCEEVVSLPVLADSSEPITGVDFGLEWDPRAGIEVLEVVPGADLPPETVEKFVAELGGRGLPLGQAAAAMTLKPGVSVGPGQGIELARLAVRAVPSAPDGAAIAFCFADGTGDPRRHVSLSVLVHGAATEVRPRTTCGAVRIGPDARPPLLLCPAPVIVSGSPAGEFVSFEIAAADNCGPVEVACDPPSGSRFAPGTTHVRCVARDRAQNVSRCSFTVTVVTEGAFRRGDFNGDGEVDISDAIAGLGFLFTSAAKPGCPDAFDANDDQKLDIADPIFTLSFLFLGTEPPPVPGPLRCEADPTPSALGACEYECLEP